MANSLVEKLNEERNSVWEKMKDLNDREINEERNLDAEEKKQWDTMNDRINEIDSRMKDLVTLEEANKKAESNRAVFETSEAPQMIEEKEEAGEPADSDIIRSMAQGEVRSHSFEKRDMSVGSDGGIVPQGFYDQIIAKIDEQAIMRQLATVIGTGAGEDMKFPQVTANSVGALVAEAGAIGESEPTTASVTLGAFKYAYLTQVSSELLADNGVDIESYLADTSGSALGRGAGVDFAVGNGSSKPNGLMNACSTGKTTAGATAITVDELISLFHSVTAPYRINASWIMNDATVDYIRKLKDGNNNYLWQPSVALGLPDILLGKPVFTDPNIETIATAKKTVAFGDMSKYFIREVTGIQVDRSVDYAFANDLVTFRFIYRADGDLMDTNAVKRMVQA